MKKAARVIIVLLLVGSFLNIAKTIKMDYWEDFNIFYFSARAAIQNSNPYLLQGTFIGGYIYPPVCLLIFYPLVVLPIALAGELWTTFSLFCLVASVWILFKLYGETSNRTLLSIVGILVFNYFPAKLTLGMGQINNVILLLITLALYALKKRRDGLAGALIGTSLSLKYSPLFLLPYLLVRLRWRTLFYIGVSITGLLILGFILINPAITIYFLQHVLPSVSMQAPGDYYNQALSGFLQRDFRQLTPVQLNVLRLSISVLLLIVTLVVIILRKLKTQTTSNLEISLFIILSLILNAFSWQHHFVLLLIPLLITYFTIKQNKLKWYYYVAIAICYVLVAVNAKNPAMLPTLLQSHVLYGAVGLWFLDLSILLRYGMHEEDKGAKGRETAAK